MSLRAEESQSSRPPPDLLQTSSRPPDGEQLFVMNPALLLLLAVAASQMDLNSAAKTNVRPPGGVIDISSCPITYYGKQYTSLNLTMDDYFSICFIENNIVTSDCLRTGVFEKIDFMFWEISVEHINKTLDMQYFKNAGTCYIQFGVGIDGSNSINMTFTLRNYHPAATGSVWISNWAAYQNTFEMFADSDQGVLDSSKSTADLDLSGCRVSGVAVVGGSEMPHPENCTATACALNTDVTEVYKCANFELCGGNSMCYLPPVVCTVTGSTVIGFHGAVHSVQDRCAYSLMKHQGSASFNLMAAFRERRRTDVPLLDHLILSLPEMTIYLEQGGRVRVGDEALVLNSTAQQHHGVELSKDQTGVTAKILHSHTTVYFDGNSAHVTGLTESLDGLCGNPLNPTLPTTPASQRSIAFSPPGCETQYQDSVDISINCNRSTDHCNLMRQPPFSACHEHTDPEPYISACTHTLCRYPSADGVDCQFLEAYAKACSLEANVTLEDWRSTSGCSPPPLCQQPCSDHEFCGEKLDSTRCFCRGLFASKYRATKSLGDPTVCRQDSASVVLAGCLLDDKGIDYSTLHLKDPSCKGHMDDKSHLVTFSFDSSAPCGTEVMKKNSQIVYKNTIMSSNSSSGVVIFRSDQFHIDFSCLYTQPEVRSVSFRIQDSSVVQQLVSGVWNYTLAMRSFSDAGLQHPVGPNMEILLNQKVWLQLEAGGLDANMVAIVTDSCWATNQASPDSNLRYDLIIKGCPNPADDTVQMQGNGQGTSSVFSFNMFEFSGGSNEIYLHCKLELCPTQGQACTPSCGGRARRRRRAADYAEGSAALITMGWRN